MGKTILADVNGWTPLMDELVKQYGLVTASIFGRVWRYCQMPDGVCSAAQETIAEELGLSRITVNRHIDILVENGYLKDLTPDLKNKAHQYADTGKVKMKTSISAVSESYTGVSESYSDGKAELQHGVSESYSKKGSLRNNTRKNLIEGGEEVAARKPRPPSDDRLNNPAIVAYKEEARMHVPISWRDDVIKTVTDVPLWGKVVHEWIGNGWNKQNIRGMLDAYRSGGIHKNGNGNGRMSKSDLARAAFGLPVEGNNGNR